MKAFTGWLVSFLLSFTAWAGGLPPGGAWTLHFNGAGDALKVAGLSSLGGTFTVEMWVKPDTLAGAQGLLGSRSKNDCGFDLKLGGGNQIHADLGNGSSWITTTADASCHYEAGSWLYVAIVVTPVSCTMYVDGQEVGAQKYPANVPILRDARHPLLLGWSGFGNEFFQGDIAAVRIWNTALETRVIARNWNRRLIPSQSPGLIACYHFDAGRGAMVHDLTGNGNDATFVGNPLWVAIRPPAWIQNPNVHFAIREIRYNGQLSAEQARFTVAIDAEATGKGAATLKLFEGDIALLPVKLPSHLQIRRAGDTYLLTATRPDRYRFTLDLVAKIQRAEPWNRISFTGPAAAIASVTAQAAGPGAEIQLLNGTPLEVVRTNDASRVRGFLGADQQVALRWQRQAAEITHQALLTVDTTAAAQFTPTVIKYLTKLHYDMLQGQAGQLVLALPVTQTLTRLAGEHIRDWQIKPDRDHQLLTIEFLKPVEKNYDLTLYSEQTIESIPTNGTIVAVNPPQPLAVDRETGTVTLTAEDTLLETESLAGLRQVNPTGKAFAAYRFHAHPFTLMLKLRRMEPVLTVADRVRGRLEETRLVVSHRLHLDVERSGIFALTLRLPPGMVVADVRGDGLEDWQAAEGTLSVSFSNRVLGTRNLEVQLEEALKTFPPQIAMTPIRVIGAAKETAQIGVAAAPGISLKTAALEGLREIPVDRLPDHSQEFLAFNATQPDWRLVLASEQLKARVVAEVFNLVTIGDGVVGGSATLRYGLANQGVQEFKVQVPSYCQNVEFTGPNIRSKAHAGNVWTIGLQDKVWGGYTLVVTYDYPFDPGKAEPVLPIGGLHALEVERETGSIAITTAANLNLTPKSVSAALHRVDESELAAADRRLITRSVLLAYQYEGGQYELSLHVQRNPAVPVLEAVADRTEITSVLTDAGEMLTQASFMVKNNQKQFQRFQLPAGAKLWSCYVNNRPARPERDGHWVLVPLPRDANRDQAFAVDIVYAQTNQALQSRWPARLALAAPRTDVPNTYAEWDLYAPTSKRLSNFGGNMNVAQGTTYGLLDGWTKFLAFYVAVLRAAGAGLFVLGALALLAIALVIAAVRRGWSGVIVLLAVVAIMAVLAAMLLPALASAKRKASRITAVSNLKQIGIAARIFAGDHHQRLPRSFEEMKQELATDKITFDPESRQRFVYVGGGFDLDALQPDSVLAFSPLHQGQYSVLFADGSVQQMTRAQFSQIEQRGFIQLASPSELDRRRQLEAVTGKQFLRMGVPAGVAAAQRAPTELPRAGTLAGNGALTVSAPPATPPPAAPGTGGSAGGTEALTYAPAPIVSGIHSIHIEIPHTGNLFRFTKVLNVSDEPISIRARIMSLHLFEMLQMAGQLIAFVLGLLLFGWQWRRERPNRFLITVALTLVIVSVSSLLIAWRALHEVLIVGFPAVTLALVAWVVWNYWPRTPSSAGDHRPPPAGPLTPEPGGPPVAAAVVLVSLLGLSQAAAGIVPIPNLNPAADVVIRTADYAGTVNEHVARVEATLQFSGARSGQRLPLFGGDVAVQDFSVRRGRAELVRDGQDVAVELDRCGETVVQIKLLVKPGGDVTKRRLEFAIPPALSSRVTLTLDQPDAEVDFPAAIALKRTSSEGGTRIEAVLGADHRVALSWTPRVKRAAETAALVFCQNAALVTYGGGVVHVDDTLDFQVAQGELPQVRVRLPAGQRLLRVEGEAIRTWQIKNESRGSLLVVDLLKAVSSSYRLNLAMEQNLDSPPATVETAIPHALGVKRETGFVALRSSEELNLSVQTASGLQRVDAEEFARATSATSKGIVGAFRFLKPEFNLVVRVETVQPQIEAVVRNNVRVASDQVALSAVVGYTIKRAGVFALRVGLPNGYRVEQVTGEHVSQWSEKTEEGVRRLEVVLTQRTTGACTLQLRLVRDLKHLPKSLAIAGVAPLGVEKLTGFISVTAEPGLAVSTESFDGLTEVPAVALPDYQALRSAPGVLAYKFIVSEPKSAPGWQLSVTTEAIAAWVRAEVANTFTVSDTRITGRARVRYEIANAPVRELHLNIPVAFKNVEVSGPNIRRRDQNGKAWRVELQNRTIGFYTLTVTWEEPRDPKTNRVELAGVSAGSVERETGFLAVVARPPLQISESVARELTRVDANEFPDWAGQPGNATVLAYRYIRPGYTLVVEAERYAQAGVLQALVDRAHFSTVISDDGQSMTEMSLELRNHGRQFLEVALPPGATVWSAFVAGQPVPPGENQGRLLLPLEQTGGDGAVVPVTLTYVGTNRFPKNGGRVMLVSPKFDVPLKNARWALYLPPNYAYADFAGTMSREVTATKPSLLSFSQSAYSRMESASQAQAQKQAGEEISQAQQLLESGKVREAMANLNRAAAGYYANKPASKGVKQLEKDLKQAQASNLIRAQDEFAARNAGRWPGQSGQPAAQVQRLYDSAAAEAQWMKLQQAQELAAAKVQPLHVNLPLRGLPYNFTQVLQTRVHQSMTIQFSATRTGTANWPARIGWSVFGFLALWVLVAVVMARKPRSA